MTSESSTTTSTTTPPTTTTQLPAPQNLTVVSDLVKNKKRTVELEWSSPSSPPYGIDHYDIYRDTLPIGSVTSSSSTINYTDSNFEKEDYSAHTYYVTVTYSNGVESGPSNEVTTTPTNL